MFLLMWFFFNSNHCFLHHFPLSLSPMKCHLSLSYLHIGVKVNLSWLGGNPSWLCSSVFVAKTVFCLGETTCNCPPLTWAAVAVPNTLEPPRDYEHFRWCVCHNARGGRRGWPDLAPEAPDADWDSWTFQQLEPGLYHPSLRWKGNVENHHWILSNGFMSKENSNERKGEALQRAGLVLHSQILSGHSVPSQSRELRAEMPSQMGGGGWALLLSEPELKCNKWDFC